MNLCEHPPDVTLLLRAHAEQRWLSREVIPVVRQIEARERLPAGQPPAEQMRGERLSTEQLAAALAYLEVIWAEAVGFAREADAALRRLDTLALEHRSLPAKACRYHASVRSLRDAVALRVEASVAKPLDYAGVASSACSR